MLERLNEALLVMLIGMTSVILTLLLMALLIQAGKWLDEKINAVRIRRYSAKIEKQTTGDELNDEIVAVITAAVITTYRKKIRVRKIRFLDHTTQPTWAITGRLNIMGSHLITKRKS